jgi:branched-chain amino acid transport system permease protein
VTKFLQLVSQGVALGAVYALVALGFVVIYRATGVINFAQGGLVLLGAFLVYNATFTWGLSFWPAVLVAMIMGAAIGAFFEAIVLRRMIGRPVYAIILATVGLLIIINEIVSTIWKTPAAAVDSPWGLDKITVGDVKINQVDIATVIVAALLVGIFFLVFRYTKVGVAMRATAIDQEAALAQGISVRRMFALSWAIAGSVAVMAGVMLGSNAGPGIGLSATIGLVALKAFPAMVLGGLDSPGGAVVGGLIIGLTQMLTGGYQPEYVKFLGDSFSDVMPYFVMLIVLLIRPYGLFGSREVRRV